MAGGLGTARPEQALAILAFAALGEGLVLGNIGPVVQLLSEHAQDAPVLGEYDQTVVALVAASSAVADLAEFIVQGSDAREIQFREVVQAQGNTSVFKRWTAS